METKVRVMRNFEIVKRGANRNIEEVERRRDNYSPGG
jgi:hypothetical protein